MEEIILKPCSFDLLQKIIFKYIGMEILIVENVGMEEIILKPCSFDLLQKIIFFDSCSI